MRERSLLRMPHFPSHLHLRTQSASAHVPPKWPPGGWGGVGFIRARRCPKACQGTTELLRRSFLLLHTQHSSLWSAEHPSIGGLSQSGQVYTYPLCVGFLKNNIDKRVRQSFVPSTLIRCQLCLRSVICV